MLHKNEHKFQGLWNRPPAKYWVKGTLFYTTSKITKIFIVDSSNLKHLKNVKSINNTTSSYLLSCRVIPRPATMKG